MRRALLEQTVDFFDVVVISAGCRVWIMTHLTPHHTPYRKDGRSTHAGSNTEAEERRMFDEDVGSTLKWKQQRKKLGR